MGQPAASHVAALEREQTLGTETSQYREEKKTNVIS